jgi:hypothetical protein
VVETEALVHKDLLMDLSRLQICWSCAGLPGISPSNTF